MPKYGKQTRGKGGWDKNGVWREEEGRKRARSERGKGGGIFRRLCSARVWPRCRAIKLRNGGSPLDVWRELHSLVKASRNSRRYRHRRGYINVSSYVLTGRSILLARSLLSATDRCMRLCTSPVDTHVHARRHMRAPMYVRTYMRACRRTRTELWATSSR